MTAGGRVVVGPPADRDKLIEWLVKQVQDLSNALYTLQTRVAQLPDEWRRDIAVAQSEAKRHAEILVQGLAHQNIALRLLGVGFVVIGIMLGAAAHVI